MDCEMLTRNSPLGRLHQMQRKKQLGVVLFVALIVMVALSLAGIALIRSIDTTTSVSGNIAFRQAALLQANWAIEDAVARLYADESKLSADQRIDTTQDKDFLDQFYLASYDPDGDSSKANGGKYLPEGIPKVLWSRKVSAWPVALDDTTSTGNKVKYVVQRMCTSDILTMPVPPPAAVPQYCDMMSPKLGGGTVGNSPLTGLYGPYPLYRITVRVDGPSNSLAFVQAMIRG
jgi:type IV pilus assembly protein PilX